MTSLKHSRRCELVEQFAERFAGEEEVDFVDADDFFATEGFAKQGNGCGFAVGGEDSFGFPLFSMAGTEIFAMSLGLLQGPPNAEAWLQDIRAVLASFLLKLLTLENNEPDVKPWADFSRN